MIISDHQLDVSFQVTNLFSGRIQTQDIAASIDQISITLLFIVIILLVGS